MQKNNYDLLPERLNGEIISPECISIETKNRNSNRIKLCACGCGCGCGCVIDRNKIYVNGHSTKGKSKINRGFPDEIYYCRCGCGTQIKWQERYKYSGWAKFVDGHYSNKENWEKRYGEEKAKEMKENLSKLELGKTFEDRFGEERAKEIKSKCSNSARKRLTKTEKVINILTNLIRDRPIWNTDELLQTINLRLKNPGYLVSGRPQSNRLISISIRKMLNVMRKFKYTRNKNMITFEQIKNSV